MTWDQILTAGVTSAIVSSAVTLITSLINSRYNRKKDRHTLLFSRLEQLREKVIGLDQIDRIWIKEKIGTEADVAELFSAQTMEAYNTCVELYEKNRFCFSKNDRERLDKLRAASQVNQLKAIELEDTEVEAINRANVPLKELLIAVFDFIQVFKATIDARLEAIPL